jgi:hypothetical protein
MKLVEFLLLQLLDVQQRIMRSAIARMSSSSLTWIAAYRSRVFWIKNTIRNVMIVVPC